MEIHEELEKETTQGLYNKAQLYAFEWLRRAGKVESMAEFVTKGYAGKFNEMMMGDRTTEVQDEINFRVGEEID
jgi:hypothetical protein